MLALLCLPRCAVAVITHAGAPAPHDQHAPSNLPLPLPLLLPLLTCQPMVRPRAQVVHARLLVEVVVVVGVLWGGDAVFDIAVVMAVWAISPNTAMTRCSMSIGAFHAVMYKSGNDVADLVVPFGLPRFANFLSSLTTASGKIFGRSAFLRISG